MGMTAGAMRRRMYGYRNLPDAGKGGVVTRLWRRRSEIMLLAGTVTLGVVAFRAYAWWGFGLLSGMVAIPTAFRSGRRRLMAHLLCVYSRHRMRRVFLEVPLCTRSGRIPLVLWITPTPEGEKALVLCRAGICLESFEYFAGEFAAACGGRTARIAPYRDWSNLVTIEIVRREVPAAGRPVDRAGGRRAGRSADLSHERIMDEPARV